MDQYYFDIAVDYYTSIILNCLILANFKPILSFTIVAIQNVKKLIMCFSKQYEKILT